MSDSNGYIHDPNGINLDVVKDIKEVRRGRIKEYVEKVSGATYTEGKGIWSVPCDIALPCATQNELDLEDAKMLVANGCFAVAEGANMPTTLDATKYLQENGVWLIDGKAANAGGVSVSGLEMAQNSQKLSWSAAEVDARLKEIMAEIHHQCELFGKEADGYINYVKGANVAGFMKVARAMQAQGIL